MRGFTHPIICLSSHLGLDTFGFQVGKEAMVRRQGGGSFGGKRRESKRGVMRIGRVARGGEDRPPPCPLLSSPSPTFPSSTSSSLPAPQLLVYISPKDVIELNKAFLRGSCHSCCLWHVKRPATLRALTYAPN